MTDKSANDGSETEKLRSTHEVLLRMALATDVLEGLDELGLDSREQVATLLAELERQIGDAT